MKVFRYKIYKGNELVLTNWINRESKELALADLEPVKNEHEGTSIKITEVSSSNNGSC